MLKAVESNTSSFKLPKSSSFTTSTSTNAFRGNYQQDNKQVVQGLQQVTFRDINYDLDSKMIGQFLTRFEQLLPAPHDPSSNSSSSPECTQMF